MEKGIEIKDLRDDSKLNKTKISEETTGSSIQTHLPGRYLDE